MKINAVKEFREKRSIYESFTQKIHSLIAELLENEDVKVHLIESRVKGENSFIEKIGRPNKVYKDPLNDVTDLSGLRVIVYYNDDVLKVANVIEQEFERIECEDTHQQNNYEADSFGYLSLHYIIKINESRNLLKEWERFKNIKCEIQIRTVLQHGWAAISHALQYKNENDVPKPFRRKLFRLAGLFELADEEFMSIRDLARSNKSEVKFSIASGDKDIDISPTSLEEFILSWKYFSQILHQASDLSFEVIGDEEAIEGAVDFEGYENYDKNLCYYGVIAKQCERIGIMKISQLEEVLKIDFSSYLSKLIDAQPGWHVSNSFILYLLLIRSRIDDFSTKNLVDDGWYDKLAAETIKIAKEDKKAKSKVNA